MDQQAIKLSKAMDQLLEGKKIATQLQQFIFESKSGLGPAQADLVAKILGTFNNTISVLDSFEPNSSSSSLVAVEASQNASCDNEKVEDSVDSRKKLGPVKGKRGCYKRKKRSETWTIESPTLEDAFSWRKYGQKVILNAKFPRGYFRCTHKYTQGCKATKQVQKIELEPKMYNITYIGNHTCNTTEETVPKVQTCDHHDEISMDSEEHKSPSLTTSMKEEELENHNHGSSNENDLSLVWPEMVFEEDHHHHHQAIYVSGGTSTTISVLSSQDLMVFGDGPEFGFSDNEQFSIFN